MNKKILPIIGIVLLLTVGVASAKLDERYVYNGTEYTSIDDAVKNNIPAFDNKTMYLNNTEVTIIKEYDVYSECPVSGPIHANDIADIQDMNGISLFSDVYKMKLNGALAPGKGAGQFSVESMIYLKDGTSIHAYCTYNNHAAKEHALHQYCFIPDLLYHVKELNIKYNILPIEPGPEPTPTPEPQNDTPVDPVVPSNNTVPVNNTVPMLKTGTPVALLILVLLSVLVVGGYYLTRRD